MLSSGFFAFEVFFFFRGQEALHVIQDFAQAWEGVDGRHGFASPDEVFEVLVVGSPVHKVLCEGHIANMGGRQAAAPSKAIARPGCEVGIVVGEARAKV